MFFIARQAAATLAGRAGRTSTTSTRDEVHGQRRSLPPGEAAIIDGMAPATREPARERSCVPCPARLARVLSALVLVAWVGQMGLLVRRAWSSSSVALAADLAAYGPSAQWRGIYYRGEKIGFSVGQTTPDRGRLRDPRGRPAADDAARRDDRGPPQQPGARSTAPSTSGASRSPSTRAPGPTEVSGTLDGTAPRRSTVRTPSGERTETRELARAAGPLA